MLRYLKLKMEIKIKTINWCFHINDENLLQRYKAISIKIEDLKDIELNALLVYDDRYVKTKIRPCGDKFILTFVA